MPANRKRLARSLRLQGLSLSDVVELGTLRKTVEDPFPESPLLLREALTSVLWRLDDIKPKESGFARMHLRYLAAIESLMDKHLSRSEQNILVDRIKFHLDAIANAPHRGKLQHDKAAIAKQSMWLTSYLNENSFPLHNMAKLGSWLLSHVQPLLDLIIIFPCCCQYPKDTDQVVDRIVTDAQNDNYTPVKLIFLVLSALHQSTPAGIEKYLKKARKDN